MTTDSRMSLDPEVVEKISGLELKARSIVEGFISGLHKSPFRGSSVEFAEHREYVPGDDMRFLDWKVFGKTDRLYIKRYEEETNLDAHVVVDASNSMGYRSAKGPSKFEYASWCAAALAWLITEQRDSVGLVLFDENVRKVVPAASNRTHLMNILGELERALPGGNTGIARALGEAGEAVRRRGLVVLFSDLMDDSEEILRGLKQVRHRGHEVLLFHVLSHDEVTFPFDRLTRFEGLETDDVLTADPASLRAAYLEEVKQFRRRLRRVCLANRIDLVEMDTAEPLGVVLSAYLAKRGAARRS
ncbi:MAG: DUF58 domain-containing protein [Planctomycetota bacterium]|nr:DUF58 domain-containing protein [Planctomycetota bacterium]